MRDFIIRITSLTADCLAAAGETIKDEDIIEFVSDALGPDFMPFIFELHTQPELLFDDFLQMVIKEDKFLRQVNPLPTQTLENPIAFAANYRNKDYRN